MRKKGLQTINCYFFKDKRLDKGLTQQEVAKKLNCSISTISKIEQDFNYFRNCKFSFVLLYLELLEVDLIYFQSYMRFGKDIEVFTK